MEKDTMHPTIKAIWQEAINLGFQFNESDAHSMYLAIKPDLVVWNKEDPKSKGSYLCRMKNAYIKMCYWDGYKWTDMWEASLEGEVKYWMNIPY